VPDPSERDRVRSALLSHQTPADRRVLSFEDYDTLGRSGVPDPQSAAPPTSPEATLVRRAAGTAVTALMDPVQKVAAVFRNVPGLDVSKVTRLNANQAVDEAESLARAEPTAATRARREAGERAFPDWAATGDLAGEAGAGALTGAAMKAAPAVRAELGRTGFVRPPNVSDREWEAIRRASQRGVAVADAPQESLTSFQQAIKNDLMDKGLPHDDALMFAKDVPDKQGFAFGDKDAWSKWKKDAAAQVNEYDSYFDYIKNEIKAGAKNFSEAIDMAKKKGTYNTGADYDAYYNNPPKKSPEVGKVSEGPTYAPPQSVPSKSPVDRRLEQLAGRGVTSAEAKRAADFIAQHPDKQHLYDYTFAVEGMNNMLAGREGHWNIAKEPMLRERAAGLGRILEDAEKAGHVIRGTTFRGLTLPQEVIDVWKAAGGFRNESFLSTSATANYGEGFGHAPGRGEKRVLLRLRSESGVPISGKTSEGKSNSAFGSSEDEVLFRPGKRWKILSSKEDPATGTVIIDAMEVKRPEWGQALPITGVAAAAGAGAENANE